MAKATWTSLKTASKDELLAWDRAESDHASHLVQNVINHFTLMKEEALDHDALPVSRYTHSLQTATRALRDGQDEEYVMCALLHDIGDILCPFNHQDVAVAILKPFVSEKNLWIVQQHALFQGYYFFHYVGGDRHARDQFKDHRWYGDVAEFCEKYDQAAFDPDYETLPFEHFEPMLHRLFAKPKWASDTSEAASAIEAQIKTSS